MGKSFNGNQTINTFKQGMDFDSTFMDVNSQSYTYANNVRIIVNEDSGTGILQAVEGFTKLETPIVYKINGSSETGLFDSNNHYIIGIGVIRDYACIFTRSLYNNTNSIFRLKLENDLVDLTKIITGDFNINNGENKDFSIVTRWEDFDNIKVYWADGINPLRYINISESADKNNLNRNTAYFESNTGIDISKPIIDKFVSGSLTVGLIQYAYQLFTLNGAESTISPLSDLIHLTQSNFDSVNYQGSSKDTNSGKSVSVKFKVNDDTFNKCRVYSIHYKDAGQLPNIKIVSEFDINLREELDGSYQYFTDPGSFLSEMSYEEFVGSQPYYFIPKVLESKDDRLFAANIVEDNWTLPSFGEEGWYDTRAFRFATNSANGIHAKLLSNNQNEKIVKTNMLSKLTYSDIEWANFLPENHDCINPINQNLVADIVKDESSYEYYPYGSNLNTKGGAGRNISFKIIHTKFGEDFYGKTTNNASAFENMRYDNLNMHARKVDIKNSSTPNKEFSNPKTSLDLYNNIPEIGTQEYDDPGTYIELQKEALNINRINYSNPFLDTKFRSYQRDELYRFGVVFYDKKGRSTSVYWISDVRMPAMTEKEHRLFDQYGRIKRSSDSYDVFQVVTYPMGLQFTFSNLPEEVSQLEIVRAKREYLDRSIVSQGIISKNAKEKPDVGIGITRPLTSMTYADSYGSVLRNAAESGDDNERWNIRNYKEFMTNSDQSDIPYIFSSSEISYFGKEIKNRFDGTLYLNPLYGLSSPTKPDFATFNQYTRETYEDGVFVYNSQFWFTGGKDNIFWTSASDDNIREMANDGTVDIRNNNDLHLFTTGFNKSKGGRPETKVRLIGKLYNPFTTYTTSDSNFSLRDKVVNIQLDNNNKIADLLPYDTILKAEKIDGYKQNIGIDVYQNWTTDRWFNRDTTKDSQKTKHGPHGPALIFKSKQLFEEIPSIYKIGTSYNNNNTLEYSNYFGNKNFDNLYIGYNINNVNSSDKKARAYTLNSTFLTNIKRNITPYSGLDYSSRTNTRYISTGSVINIDGDNDVTLNVFGGDTYIGINEYMVQHWYYLKDDPTDENSGDRGQKAQIVVYYPSESSINLSLVMGSSFFRYANEEEYPYDIQEEPVVLISGFSQEKPLYSYNSVYSAENEGKYFVPMSMYSESNKNIDYRVVYSEAKTNDEISDSWLKFKPANYLDVDTRFGSVNNMRTFNNTLYFWQNDSFGALSVNPRSLITDNKESTLLLGKGDVLSSYSYITNQNGSKPNVINNVCLSANSLYWYDHDRAELLRLQSGLEPLSKSKKIQSYFNKNKKDIKDSIKTLYDKKYNEVHYKFDIDGITDEHLVFNEQLNNFISFHSNRPDWFIDLKDVYYSIKLNEIYKNNSNKQLNKFFGVNSEPTVIKTLVNENYPYTKVFDNVEFDGNFDSMFTDIYFNTKTQESDHITSSEIDLREDNYRFAIPRCNYSVNNGSEIAPNFKDRMRGKYLQGTYIFNPKDSDEVFKVPYIKTSYRISNI